MQSLPLHPRLARILIAGGGSPMLARACAILSERLFVPPRAAATTSDLLSALDGWAHLPVHVHRAAQEIERMANQLGDHQSASLSDEEFRKALLRGYPDRVAQRREPRSPRVRLATGAGGAIGRESGVLEGEFLVAVDVQASTRSNDPDSRIRLASVVDRGWLVATSTEVVHRLDESGAVRAVRLDRYDALVLAETPERIDDEVAAPLLAAAWLERRPSDDDLRILRRLKFAGLNADLHPLVSAAAHGARRLSDINLLHAMPSDTTRAIDRHAPDTLQVPSGRSVRLEYAEDGSVSASVKLQELFGLAETPRIGLQREPVLLSLLAPNGRSVQVTRDLRSFWDRTYPEVRKELRGRYPKHPWPEDPWNAPPTARTKRRA